MSLYQRHEIFHKTKLLSDANRSVFSGDWLSYSYFYLWKLLLGLKACQQQTVLANKHWESLCKWSWIWYEKGYVFSCWLWMCFDLFSLQISSIEYFRLLLTLNFIALGIPKLGMIPLNLENVNIVHLLIAANVTLHTVLMQSGIYVFAEVWIAVSRFSSISIISLPFQDWSRR